TIFTILKIKFDDLLLEKKIVFGHKKICTLVSWLFSPTFGVQIISPLFHVSIKSHKMVAFVYIFIISDALQGIR
ncbi:hypothetical protein, partial [Haemophilus haemolyticus]|uniref:hypothetical protein n=1 Tax=Haemophilus haemolyticus TaxID=726 RepID=UPI00195A314E